MSDRLFVQLQGETVKMLSLEMSLLSIGRTPDNGLALPNPAVAIRHAEVRRLEGRFVITDLGNAETFLDGRRLVPFQPQVLHEGALVQVGPYVLAYLPGDEQPPAAKPEPAPPPATFTYLPLASPRPRSSVAAAPGSASQYLQYLPALFSESDFLGRYLMIFQTIWEPLQHRQDHLELYFSPTTAPEGFLGWLAGWLGLELDPHWPEARKRAWLAETMHLLRWRGTPYGVRRAIELGCGVTPHIREDPARPYFLQITMPDPEQAGLEAVTREGTLNLIARHLPAWVEYDVQFVSPDNSVPLPPPTKRKGRPKPKPEDHEG